MRTGGVQSEPICTYRPKIFSRLMDKVTSAITGIAAPWTLAEVTSSGQLHLMFPGLFNEAWLYVNGTLVAHRSYKEPWWRTDYRFSWDVDISSYVHQGTNEIALRGFNPHHFAGIFRRPFLYRPL